MNWNAQKAGLARFLAFAVSAALHGVAAAALIGLSSTDPPVPLPMVAVEIVAAAPPGAGGPAVVKGARTPRAGAQRASRASAAAPPRGQPPETKAPPPRTRARPKAKAKPLAPVRRAVRSATRRSPSQAAIRPARPPKPRISKRALQAAARSARRKRRLKARPRPQVARYRKAKPRTRSKPGNSAAASTVAASTGAVNMAAMAYRPPRPGGGNAGNPLPKYPRTARRRGAEGRVVLAVRVGADGRAQSVVMRRSSGHADLDAAALAAVRRWRFAPASRGGASVEGLAIVPIRFRLVTR